MRRKYFICGSAVALAALLIVFDCMPVGALRCTGSGGRVLGRPAAAAGTGGILPGKKGGGMAGDRAQTVG